jgi:hypothetical protein
MIDDNPDFADEPNIVDRYGLNRGRSPNLDRNLDLDHTLTLALALRNLTLPLDECMTKLIRISGEMNMLDLQEALQGVPLLWRHNVDLYEGDAVQQLRQIAIQYRDVGHKWDLSDKQWQLLARYLEGNQLLVEWLGMADISEARREAIENQLLLV